MSRNTTEIAKRLSELYPKAYIIGCTFRDNPKESREWDWKLKIFPPGRSYWTSLASSTTDERLFLTNSLPVMWANISNSIVVGNGAHIRRASMVWEHYHPDAHLCFVSTNAKGDDDLENPMTAQRRWQIWVLANLVGILFYKLLGVEYFAKKNLSQPVD